jgi:hypothetical protein
MAALAAVAMAAVTIKPEKRLPMTISFLPCNLLGVDECGEFEVLIITRRIRLGASNLKAR